MPRENKRAGQLARGVAARCVEPGRLSLRGSPSPMITSG